MGFSPEEVFRLKPKVVLVWWKVVFQTRKTIASQLITHVTELYDIPGKGTTVEYYSLNHNIANQCESFESSKCLFFLARRGL